MKLFVYSYREFDEADYFQQAAEEYGTEIAFTAEEPSMENADFAEGYPYVSIITTKIDEELLKKFWNLGVRMISTRTIGYDHIDVEVAKRIGFHISHVTYSPECVADYTLMLMLMCIRKMKRIMQREELNDFSLPGIRGRELRGFTVGVIGTGRIGQAVIRDLSGFGCRIYAYDLYRNAEVERYAEYVELKEIYETCDMITLHMPLNDANYHMIDHDAIGKMRKGTVLINTARGALIDTAALLDGLESEQIGAVGLDVIEDEFGMYYYDRKSDILSKRDLYTLRGFPNVIVTPHMAFYTEEAVGDMVRHSVKSCVLHEAGKEDPWEVV